jgi:predicted acetyltransferase
VPDTPIDYRTLRPGEFDALADNLDLAFHEHSTPAKREQWRTLIPLDRTIAAFEGPLLVGTSAAYRQRLSVPGGELPCAGVTVVTVRPTHRRRGILTGMMARLFEQARAAGEPLAALWAAEGGIYERFGYGAASRQAHIVLPGGGRPPRPALDADDERRLTLELIDLDGAAPLLAPLWERLRGQRAGIPARTPNWWTHRVLSDLDEDRDGALRKRLLLARAAGADGEPRGYAIYRASGVEPAATLEVLELIAPDADADAALWGYLCGVDLIGAIDAPSRPVDDPAPYRFADFRQPRVVEVRDALWLRLLDLPAALGARRWRGPLNATLEVTDARLPDNAGRWRLQASAGGEARCERTERPADLALDVAALGAAYLGGTGVAQLADAGRISERTPGALDAFDAALHTGRAPWTPEIF